MNDRDRSSRTIIRETSRSSREARAQLNESRAEELIQALESQGVRAEAGEYFGSTHITLRFDEVERLLPLLGARTPKPSSSGSGSGSGSGYYAQPRAEVDEPATAWGSDDIRPVKR